MSEVIYTVSQVNNYISKIFESESLLKGISVSGEITNASRSGSAIYFNIKDDQSMLSCVCFDSRSAEVIKNGSQVLVIGSLNYYSKGGRLTFIVKSITPYGEGLLYKKFLELKEKLSKEGLFNEEYKKPIPKYVKRIGVVSSNTGAVIQDIINITTRRNDSVDIVLYPVKVQGVGAEEQIVKGINFFSDYEGIDVVIVARGGGSFEDLMPFNTEIVARSAFNCKKPLVSAVGHETDFTIIDFVADLRAPTPSAAAELCVFEKQVEIDKNIATIKYLYDLIQNRAKDDSKIIIENVKRVTNLVSTKIDYINEKIVTILKQVSVYVDSIYKANTINIEHNIKLIENMNPQSIINRGYAKLVSNGNIVMSAKNVKIDDEISIIVKDGTIVSKVKEVKKWWLLKKKIKDYLKLLKF